MRMCSNIPRYQLNYFHLFLASLYAPSCFHDEDLDSDTNPFKEGGVMWNPRAMNPCKNRSFRLSEKLVRVRVIRRKLPMNPWVCGGENPPARKYTHVCRQPDIHGCTRVAHAHELTRESFSRMDKEFYPSLWAWFLVSWTFLKFNPCAQPKMKPIWTKTVDPICKSPRLEGKKALLPKFSQRRVFNAITSEGTVNDKIHATTKERKRPCPNILLGHVRKYSWTRIDKDKPIQSLGSDESHTGKSTKDELAEIKV